MGHSGAIVDEGVFSLLTELEIHKAVRLQYPVSVIALVAEPDSVRAVPRPDVLTLELARTVSPVVRGTDAVTASHRSPHIEVLLVNADVDDLPAIVRRIGEELSHHRFRIDQESVTVKSKVGTASFPSTAASGRELRRQAAIRAAGENPDESAAPEATAPTG